jgi:hypothetical protein
MFFISEKGLRAGERFNELEVDLAMQKRGKGKSRRKIFGGICGITRDSAGIIAEYRRRISCWPDSGKMGIEMRTPLKRTILAVAVAAATTGILNFHANAIEAHKAENTKDVMKLAHKGEDSISKRVSEGKGTDEEIKLLLSYYKLMAREEPPRGSKESWHEKTAALVKATEALSNHQAGAVQMYKEAVNCKACHSQHKPEKK